MYLQLFPFCCFHCGLLASSQVLREKEEDACVSMLVCSVQVKRWAL